MVAVFCTPQRAMSHFAVTGHSPPMSDLPKEAALQRLEDAEIAVRRALQTIERQVHLAKSGSEDDPREMLSTAQRELELALAGLSGTQQDLGESAKLPGPAS